MFFYSSTSLRFPQCSVGLKKYSQIFLFDWLDDLYLGAAIEISKKNISLLVSK